MLAYIRTAVILTAALTVISCDAGSFLEPGLDDGEPTRLEVASLVLDSLPPMVAEGDTVHLRVTALAPDGEPIEESIEVQWSSSDGTVATFDSISTTEADLVAKQPGTTTITASYEGTSSSTTVEVHKRPVDVVYVAGSGQQAAPGDTLTDSLTVRVVDKRGDAVSGVYLDFVVVTGGGTASPAGGTTDNAGHLSAAWILGEAGDQVVEARVSQAQTRVKKVQDSVVVFTAQLAETTTQTVTASSVTIDPDSATMEEDTVVDLDAVVHDSDGNTMDGASVSWASSDTTVATIDTSGLVTPVAAGQITISATVDGVTGEAAVTVEDTASGTLTITSVDTTLDGVGDTLTLTVEARDADGALISDPDVQWSSDDTTIATVDTMGFVTARGIGTAIIGVTAACCSGDFGDVVVADGAPAQVTDLAVARVGVDSVTLQWTEVDDGTGSPADYALRYGSPTLDWRSGAAYDTEVTVEGSTIGSTATYTFTDLNGGNVHEFGIVSYRGTIDVDAVYGDLSNFVTGTPRAELIAGDVSALSDDGKVHLNATAASGGSPPYRYQWHRSTSSGFSRGPETELSGATSLQVVDSTVTNGTTYYYQLQVRDSIGHGAGYEEVSATPEPGNPLHPNEPLGMTVIGHNEGDVKEADGSAFGITAFGAWIGGDNVSVVDDLDNPTGSGKALRLLWDAADCCLANADWEPKSELYLVLRYVIEAPFEWSHKLFYLLADGQGSSGEGIWAAREANGNLRVIAGGNEVVVHADSVLAPRDTELAIEFHFVAESSVGAGDGQVHVWVNGTKVGENTSMAMADIVISSATWVGMQFYAVANSTPTTEVERLREVYISGK